MYIEPLCNLQVNYNRKFTLISKTNKLNKFSLKSVLLYRENQTNINISVENLILYQMASKTNAWSAKPTFQVKNYNLISTTHTQF